MRPITKTVLTIIAVCVAICLMAADAGLKDVAVLGAVAFGIAIIASATNLRRWL